MKISPQPDYGLNPVAPLPASWTGVPAPAAAPAANDEVALTEQGQELQRLSAHIAALPEPLSPRAAEVMARIQAGDYHVPAEQVAASIVRRWEQQRLAGQG